MKKRDNENQRYTSSGFKQEEVQCRHNVNMCPAEPDLRHCPPGHHQGTSRYANVLPLTLPRKVVDAPSSQTSPETNPRLWAVPTHDNVNQSLRPPVERGGVSHGGGRVSDSNMSETEDEYKETQLFGAVRKKTREKQRRAEMAAMFKALAKQLEKIEEHDLDPEVLDNEEEIKKSNNRRRCFGSSVPSNRIFILGRAIEVIESLCETNRKLKKTVRTLRNQQVTK